MTDAPDFPAYLSLSLLDQAAGMLLRDNAAILPVLSEIIVVVPHRQAITGFIHALTCHADGRALLLPRITTLPDWAAGVPGSSPEFPDSRRQALLYQLLKQKGWFNETDLWQISAELVALFDELTAHSVRLPDSEQDFVKALAHAYQMRAREPLQFEARLVHELWMAMASDTESSDKLSRYHHQLFALAQSAQAPLYVIGMVNMTPVERDFFAAYGRKQPVRLFPDKNEENQPSSIALLLQEAWPYASQDVPPLSERAITFALTHADSPVAGRGQIFAAQSLEQEAEAADLAIRRWLLQGKQSIAVIAQDRVVARRVRALLERYQVLAQDETGWTLSTTSASTVVARWLDTVAGRFYFEDLLGLLKSPFILAAWSAERRKHAVYRLERWIRKGSVGSGLAHYVELVEKQADTADVLSILARLRQAEEALGRKRQTLSMWLERLAQSLDILGVTEGLAADIAGNQLLQLLSRLRNELGSEQGTYSFAEWRNWLARQFEEEMFRDTAIKSPVIFTHMGLVSLRNWDAAIVLGCDADQLPGKMHGGLFFNQSVRSQLGLPTAERQLQQSQMQLCSLIADCPAVMFTWQATRNGQPNLKSPFLERLQAFHVQAYNTTLDADELAAALAAWRAATASENPALATSVAAPVTPVDLIPASISAGAYNSLLACPYQFFTRYMLRLKELDEVQESMEKSDYGESVHQILHRFHLRYPTLHGMDRDELVTAMSDISDDVFTEAIATNYLSQAWLLRWKRVIPGYLDWQLKREAEGWRWSDGEVEKQRVIALDDERSVLLKGRLDRIDVRNENGIEQIAVLDYKTAAKKTLKKKLDQSGEDVQLAVYAELLERDVAEAAYVIMGTEQVEKLGLDAPAQSAAAAVQRLQVIFNALYQAAPVTAQGIEGVCQYCEMRGLCRRDYWPDNG